MTNDKGFFDEPKPESKDEGEVEETSEELKKIKLGEKEYTQDDLSKLVGLGEKYQEIEGKYDQSLDGIAKSWGERGNRIGELKKQVEELEKFKTDYESKTTQAKVASGEELTPEEQAKQIIDEAKKLGLVTREDFKVYYTQQRQAEKILEEAESLVKEVKEDGRPETNVEEILQYMADSGVKSVNSAYKLLKDEELTKWNQEQLGKVKKTGMVTEESSTAGSKQPTPKKVTKDNLNSALKAHFS